MESFNVSRLPSKISTCAVRHFTAEDAKDAKSFFVFFAVERTAKKKEHVS